MHKRTTFHPCRALACFFCLFTAVSLAFAESSESKLTITPNSPGALYIEGEKVAFTVKLSPADSATTNASVAVVISDINGNTLETIPELNLSAQNNYAATIEPKTVSLGYYTITAGLADSKLATNKAALSFGIIPDVRLRNPEPNSPFGVATHYMRWHKDGLPGLQAKLGISWFREELDFRKSADKNQPSPLVALAERNNLTWLPVIDYIDANRGVETNGTWHWDAEMAQVKRTFEIHKGKLHVYESQNEPNNFGNWAKRFTGPASPWLADNWGKPFCDLAKAMKQTLGEVDPQAKLLWPDLDSPAWINTFATKFGAAPFIDGVAPHPYSLHGQLPEEQEYVRNANSYLAMLDSNHIPRSVWITELGYTTYKNPAYKKGMIAYHPLTEQQQAAWLVRAFVSHLGWGVSHFFWYDLLEDGTDDRECEHRFGLLRHGSLSPKPAAIAYANLVHEAKDCQSIASVRLGAAQDACAYAITSAQAKYPVIVAWVVHGTARIQLPETALVTNIFGLKINYQNGIVMLGESPLYIHGVKPEALHLE